jgi:site-specific DNA-methyltransferase (adenine-specific)/modification methylase
MAGDLRPYWQSADGAITVYHARWEDVHAAGAVGKPDLIHADPPYGVNERTERAAAGRVGALARHSQTVRNSAKRASAVGLPHDFPRVHGDDRPFDPAPLLALDRPSALWGANHYSDRVPGSPSWILWDKREDQTPDDNADGELAWSNLGGPLRIFRHWWRGALRKTEKEDKHLHPTQKPIALSTYVFQRAKLRPGALVFVPYLGSGPDLPAARAMGLRVVACDVERWCCDAAIGRLGAVTAERAAEPCGPLFGGRP